MTQVALFKHRMPSAFHVLKNGKYLYFINSQLTTSVQAEADELCAEVASGHPHIYQEKGREIVDSAELEPLAALRAKFFQEFKAEAAKALNPDNDRGNSENTRINPANSRDVAAAAANGVVAGMDSTVVDDGSASTGGAKVFNPALAALIKRT